MAIIDREQYIYSKMCGSCPNAKRCHDECEVCEEYEKAISTYRKIKDLSHQEKMEIYNKLNSGQFYKKELMNEFNITLGTLNKVYKETYDLIRYKIYGEPPKEPKVCNLCGGKVKLNRCDKSKSRSGFVYYCTKCHAWVGTHPNNPKQALGELAYSDIRGMRKELHKWFDKLWRNHQERKVLYDKLAKELGKDTCHFAQMDKGELDQALTIVKKWWFQKFDI